MYEKILNKENNFVYWILDFPDTIFGNCTPHKLPYRHTIIIYILIL